MRKTSPFFGVILGFVLTPAALGAVNQPKVLHLVQIAPATADTYMLSVQKDVMTEAFELATQDFRREHPGCQFSQEIFFRTASEEELYEKVHSITKLSGKHAVIGFSRTNSARVAARAAAGSSVIGISTASFSNELATINPNFLTVSMPWTSQWELIERRLGELKCDPKATSGVFSSSDSLSLSFKKAYLEAGYKTAFEVSDLSGSQGVKPLLSSRCIVFGSSLPGSIGPLTGLAQAGWEGHAIGTGDWTYFTPEMKKFLKANPHRKLHLYSSLVWKRTENARGAHFVEKHFGKKSVDPITPAVYDATKLALSSLCQERGLLPFQKERWSRLGLLRDYAGVMESGNLISPLELVEIQ